MITTAVLKDSHEKLLSLVILVAYWRHVPKGSGALLKKRD
jgi:hypothetical protein